MHWNIYIQSMWIIDEYQKAGGTSTKSFATSIKQSISPTTAEAAKLQPYCSTYQIIRQQYGYGYWFRLEYGTWWGLPKISRYNSHLCRRWVGGGGGVGLCSVCSRKSNAYVMPLPLFRKQLLALLSFAQFTWFFNTTTWLGAALT